MYFKALPEVVKNAAAPLSSVDKITMYGEGNSSRLVGDIIGSTTKITDGLTEATGVDIRSLLAGFLGSAKPQTEDTAVEAKSEKKTFDEEVYSDAADTVIFDEVTDTEDEDTTED
jgi:flotillin